MKNNQFGRSMVEMLGVLAIIGVLSVGGILGYANAMNKHKLNKVINDISSIVQNYRIQCAGHSVVCEDMNGISYNEDIINILKSIDVIPDHMWNKDAKSTTEMLKNPFGGNVEIILNPSYFRISYFNIPQNICSGLLTANWEDIDALNIRIIESGVAFYSKKYAKEISDIPNGNSNWLPISLDKAQAQSCNQGVSWQFKI